MKSWAITSFSVSSFLLWFVLTGCTSTQFGVKSSVPVKVGPVLVDGAVEEEACVPAEAKVPTTNKNDFLRVLKGPGEDFTVVDNLVNGQRILYCDYVANGKWAGIVYKTALDNDCGTSTPIIDECPDTGPCKRAYTGPCKFGWVHFEWLKVIAD